MATGIINAAALSAAARLSGGDTIKMGRTTVNSVTSTPTTFSVTFPSAFSGAPHVIITPIRNSDAKLDAKLRSETSTGFSADIWSNSTTSVNIDVDWVAIYL